MTAVKPIINFQTVLSVPMRNKIGLFIDDPQDRLKLQSVINAIRDPDADNHVPPTVIVPTHPMPTHEDVVCHGDLVFEDRQFNTTRVLYQETLNTPMRGIPSVVNRAVMLPTYLYDEGATQFFNINFFFCELAAGGKVIDRKNQPETKTIFISLQDLRSAKL